MQWGTLEWIGRTEGAMIPSGIHKYITMHLYIYEQIIMCPNGGSSLYVSQVLGLNPPCTSFNCLFSHCFIFYQLPNWQHFSPDFKTYKFFLKEKLSSLYRKFKIC